MCERNNDMALLDQSGYKRELDGLGLKRWVFGSESNLDCSYLFFILLTMVFTFTFVFIA